MSEGASQENAIAPVSDSGIALPEFYPTDKSNPGAFPFTRGVRKEGYRGRLWTMRQYTGFGDPTQTNQRFKQGLANGQTGLSVAFDLPTQMGYDSDDPMAKGEVGKVGVAIDSLADMETLFQDIPLGEVTTSMTINATAAILLLLYELVAEKQGVGPAQLGGTVQNDILKEYVARGTYIYPPKPSMRLVVDTFAYCAKRLPRWNVISVSGYHMREAGATATQELAFALANGIAYVQAAVDRGLTVDSFAPRVSFFFNVSNDFFEEVAKFRAARELWAVIMKDRFGAKEERSLQLRCHAQTSGASLTAQEPYNNMARVALQAMAAVCGGVQSLHTNSFDEALALPSELAAEVALRTQQVIGFESGAAKVADPMGGSALLEYLTDQLVDEARGLIARIDQAGGAVAAIEDGMYARAIADSAFAYQSEIETTSRVVVGVNRFTETVQKDVEILHIDEALRDAQVAKLAQLKRTRDSGLVADSLQKIKDVAKGEANLLDPMRGALAAYATLGEVSAALREVFGGYHPSGSF